MRYLITFVLVFVCSFAYAAAPDIRISDEAGHVVDVNADGSLTITFTNEADIDVGGAPDIRISDEDGDVVDINLDGSLTVRF